MPTPSVDPISTGLVGLGALAKIWQGFSQKHQAHKINRSNPFPKETVNPLFAQNLAIAENMGRVGLPQQQYTQAQQGFQRNANMGLRQLSRLGRPSNVAGIVRAGNDSQLALDTADANARLANQRLAMGYRTQLANEQNRVWDWNVRTPFLQKTAQAQGLIGAGLQNRMAGFNDLTNLGLYAMMGNNFANGMSALNPYPYLKSQQFLTSPINGLNGGYNSNVVGS